MTRMRAINRAKNHAIDNNVTTAVYKRYVFMEWNGGTSKDIVALFDANGNRIKLTMPTEQKLQTPGKEKP